MPLKPVPSLLHGTRAYRHEQEAIEVDPSPGIPSGKSDIAGRRALSGLRFRAYYAMFNAAKTLLQADGHEAETHKGTLVLLDKHYVKEEKIDPDITQTLRQAFDVRQLADYSEEPVSPSEAEQIVQQADAFLPQIAAYTNRDV